MLILLLSIILMTCDAHANTLVFLDNSVSNDTYIPSNKEKQIKVAFEQAIEDLKKDGCVISSTQMIGRGEPLSIFNQVKEIKKLKNPFIVGLIHSSEALLAAKAFKKESILALSSGAATESLSTTNENFFSLANSTYEISHHVKNFIKNKQLKKVISIIPGNSLYSAELAKNLLQVIESPVTMNIVQIDPLNAENEMKAKLKNLEQYDLLYVPGFIQQVLPIFQAASNLGYKSTMFGSANLARSVTDLKLFTKNLQLKSSYIFFPTTWTFNETPQTTVIRNRIESKLSEEVMGTAIYTYDAAYIAGKFICSNTKMTSENFQKYVMNEVLKNRSNTAKQYLGLVNGHLISEIKTYRYSILTQHLEVAE